MKVIFTPMSYLNPTSGGMIVLEQQMADLKSAGFEVCILYGSNNEWNVFNYLDSSYSAISLSEITKRDIVVISEEFVWYGINEIASRQLNYVVINQGLFATFYSDYLSANQIKEFYKNSKLVIVNSDYTARGVKKIFGIETNKIKKYIIGIDSNLFVSTKKTKDICYSTYKNRSIGLFVDNYLQLRYPSLSVTKIECTSRNNFAEALKTHRVYLSLGGPEGFGMPPLEAAIAGCKVIGFDAYAGSEYFLPPTFIKVNQNDHLDFIDKIDYVLDNMDDSSLYDTEYVNHLRHKYSLENSRKSIIDIFSII